ncbi:MAG: hypothetical protein K2X63_05665 [Burkholderiaceae bacterium]|nr:hypothetical protein [Burkholderiaceae bacterium]
MNLEQLHFTYCIEDDRILLKMALAAEIDGHAKQEIRIFITRRLLKNLWPVIMQALSTQISLDRPDAAFASQDLVNMQYQEALNTITENGNFDVPYSDEEKMMPFGESPALLKEIKFHLHAHQPLHIQFFLFSGNQIDIRFPVSILHGFCKLLQETEQKTEWDLNLSWPGVQTPSIYTGLLN